MARRPKIAAITTEYRKFSHTQHIVDRFLEGYGWNGRHHRPPMDLVSIYVDQTPESDLSAERVSRFPHLTKYETIAEALTLGGDKLAVDGVVLVGEHGSYKRNEKGQTLYPRYEFFKEIVKVFRDSDQSVPIWNDKHLSWDWEQAKEMADTARRLGFSLMAGSSLPVTWRIPSLDFPYGAEVSEAVCVAYGGVDSYDFHALETLQCMVERRKGGESGVKWVKAYRGDDFWEAYMDGVWSRELFESALCRSHTMETSRAGFNNIFPTVDEMKQMVSAPVAFQYEHADGLKCTMFLMRDLLQDFNFAAYVGDSRVPLSTQMYLPMPPVRTTLASFFSPLVNHIETLFLTGKAPIPLERTLLTTGILAAGVESLFQDHRRQDTPHLNVTYTAPEESQYWRT
jgi:hypothetical protein